ncbi:MAG: tetratricopeptide repeat protein [Persicimonas sp.]
MRQLLLASIVIVVSLTGLAGAAFADEGEDLSAEERAEKVEALAAEGAEAYKAENYDEAIGLFEEAYEVEPVPNLLYNIAKSYEKKEEYDRAVEYYREFAISPDVDADARATAIERIESLRQIADLKQEEVDRTRQAAEQAEAGEEPTAAEGLGESEGSSSRSDDGASGSPANWWVLGTSAALLGTGATFGLMASSSAAAVQDAETFDERRAASERGPKQAALADGFLGAGLVAGAVGLYMTLNKGKTETQRAASKTTVSPWVTGDSAGVGMSLDF